MQSCHTTWALAESPLCDATLVTRFGQVAGMADGRQVGRVVVVAGDDVVDFVGGSAADVAEPPVAAKHLAAYRSPVPRQPFGPVRIGVRHPGVDGAIGGGTQDRTPGFSAWPPLPWH